MLMRLVSVLAVVGTMLLLWTTIGVKVSKAMIKDMAYGEPTGFDRGLGAFFGILVMLAATAALFGVLSLGAWIVTG